jgi:heterodisulfide reductase subunit B
MERFEHIHIYWQDIAVQVHTLCSHCKIVRPIGRQMLIQLGQLKRVNLSHWTTVQLLRLAFPSRPYCVGIFPSFISGNRKSCTFQNIVYERLKTVVTVQSSRHIYYYYN